METSSPDLPTAADLRASEQPQPAPIDMLDLSDAAGRATPPARQPAREISPSATPPPSTAALPPAKAASPSSSSLLGGWGGLSSAWGGWVDVVKKQSEAVVDVYKRDISEFVSTMTTESTSHFDKITHSLKETIHEITAPVPDPPSPSSPPKNLNETSSAVAIGDMSFSSFGVPQSQDADDDDGGGEGEGVGLKEIGARLDKMADVADEFLLKIGGGVAGFLSSAVTIIPGIVEDDEGKKGKTKAGAGAKKNIIFNRKSALVAALRTDITTFSADPAKSTDKQLASRFESYKQTFSLPNHESQITKVLEETAETKTYLDELVPADLSYPDFWLRYFFRVAEVDREEETRKQLLANAAAAGDAGEADDFSWGSEDEDEEEGRQQGGSKKDAGVAEGKDADAMPKPSESASVETAPAPSDSTPASEKAAATQQPPSPSPPSPNAVAHQQPETNKPDSPFPSPSPSPSPPQPTFTIPPPATSAPKTTITEPEVDSIETTGVSSPSTESFEVVNRSGSSSTGGETASQSGGGGGKRQTGDGDEVEEEEEDGWGEWE
ncbi:uncharacterized protein EV422DRAFT_562677 [Fimicolochytrium jonesii]|uniref:uncharacterized protein n=1 Tax=Fimicolochytrium jonesii TaxID=1396493 RepID=UPI0022FF0253|nr:uncharacterized protein EV422DRAFT_562677 [Fimicolochytrium jonesii]KAI8826616.1 hypothetical protein EV422DRAFT_562677 [Fimicolochytrium jonesii]